MHRGSCSWSASDLEVTKVLLIELMWGVPHQRFDMRVYACPQRAKANALLADRRKGPLRKGEQRLRAGQHLDSEPDTSEEEDDGGDEAAGAERWLRPTLRPNRTLNIRAKYDSGSDTEITLEASAR